MVARTKNIALRINSDKIFHFKAAIHSPPQKKKCDDNIKRNYIGNIFCV